MGKGKLEDVKQFVQAYACDCVIFDDDLTPSQVRFLEDALAVKILDRSLLILNIFSMRAQTAQAKVQVELAQYKYMYPAPDSHVDTLEQAAGWGSRHAWPG